MSTPMEFLNEEFRKRQKRNPYYSLRSFAKWLQVSPAQLSQMMTGKRNITLKTLRKINDRLELSPFQQQELAQILLAEKNWVPKDEEPARSQLDEDRFRLIADWYHLAILSLTRVQGAKADPRWISRRLGIQVEHAHQSLLRLQRMGLLEVKPKFRQIGDPFEVVSEIPSPAIRKYHQQNLGLAMEKIETVPNSQRQFQSISVATDPSSVVKLKYEIDAFLDRAQKVLRVKHPTEVYHLNVQLFPVTQTTKTKN